MRRLETSKPTKGLVDGLHDEAVRVCGAISGSWHDIWANSPCHRLTRIPTGLRGGPRCTVHGGYCHRIPGQASSIGNAVRPKGRLNWARISYPVQTYTDLTTAADSC